MAETPADQSPARTQPEIRPGSGQQYWCYHCDKRVAIDTLADLPDVVCCECKNGFVESISAAAIPSAAAVDPLDDLNIGSQFIQVLRLIAQAAREEDALPALPADPSNDDYLQIELDEWGNDDDDEDEDEDDEHSEEAENRERGTENNRSDEEEEEEEEEEEGGMEVTEEDAEAMRQYRRSVLQLSMSDASSRRMILERGLNWIDEVDDDDDEEDEEEEEDEDDEHSVEVVREEDAENPERGTDNSRNDGEYVEEEGIEVTEPRREDEDENEEMRRRHRRDVLRLSLRDFASRAASRRNRILDWADVLMGLENHSIELTLQVPDSDTYVGNPGDYVDASEYEALLQNLAESDSGGRRGAPPAAKAAVEGLESVEIDKEENTIVCSICKDSVNVGEIAKNLPCGHGYHGECIVPWLGSRNSCPVCRFELPTDDPEYEDERKKRVVVAGLRAASSSSSANAATGGSGGDSTGSALE